MMSRWQVTGVFGLLFYAYAVIRILRSWAGRNRINVSVWFVVLALIGSISFGLLFVR